MREENFCRLTNSLMNKLKNSFNFFLILKVLREKLTQTAVNGNNNNKTSKHISTHNN